MYLTKRQSRRLQIKHMLSNHKIQSALEEISDISRMEMAVYSEEGRLLAAAFDQQESFKSLVADFASSMAESQSFADVHLFKVAAEEEAACVLLVKSSAEEAYMVGRLAVCQVRHLMEAYREKFDRNNFMQNILLGNMLVVDMYNKAKKFHIEPAERVVFVIEAEGKKDASKKDAFKKDTSIVETVKNMFGGSLQDFVIEVDEQSIVVVKDARELKDEESLQRVARMIVDNLHSEAMVRVRAGYGNRVVKLQDITKSYQEAKMAIEVGRIFYAEEEAFSYSRLGIGRLIYQIPMSLCEMFIREIFGEKMPDVFSEENLVTIHKFFENNLNISETARQLFVHRNTLVYRLERLEKELGLDIRKFEDAMTFKIAMMVLSHMSYQGGLPI